MSRLDSLVNRRLNGYYIEALLGRGGMARVYRGVDVHLQRYVAIKVIDSEYRNDPSQADRFEREARVIAQLGQHPNIVRVYHYGEDQGYLYIAMEFIDGADLGTILHSYQQENERMPFDEILNVARDISGALDYMHSHGVIHRDLKPSNIMLDRHGRAILTDFGIALFTPTGTLGEVFGSPHYISPEQAVNSAQARPQSDIYSLGIVLYELFTGKLPFESDNPMNLALLHMSQPPPSPRRYRPDLSPAVEAVILKTLEKQPEDRYQSGRELYDDLERAVRSTWRNAAPPPTLARLTISEKVQRKSRPLPPPAVPAAAQAAVPPSTLPALEPLPTSGEPLVIPVEAWKGKPRRKIRWGCIGALASLVFLIFTAGVLGSNVLRLLGGAAPGFPPPITEPPTPIDTSAPTAVVYPTPLPSDLPPPNREATPTQETFPPGQVYELLLIKFSGDFLIVMNNGEENLPLLPLQLGNNRSAIPGAAWGLEDLEPGDCVVAIRTSRKPRIPPDTGCTVLGVLQGSSNVNLWNRDFEIFFNNQMVGECPEEEGSCQIQIPRLR